MTCDDVLTFQREKALDKGNVIVKLQGISVGEPDEQRQRIAELEDSVSRLETLRSEIAVLRQALTALQKDRMMRVARR